MCINVMVGGCWLECNASHLFQDEFFSPPAKFVKLDNEPGAALEVIAAVQYPACLFVNLIAVIFQYLVCRFVFFHEM